MLIFVDTVTVTAGQLSDNGHKEIPSAPCQTQPDPGNTPDKEKSNPKKALAGSKLDHCDGVLTPPRTGDRIEEPPPATGTTPIIRPDEVPAQPPN
ncbi:hypothetical protein NDO48_17130 [Aminobacter sp. MET-1]|nr:hypothetical protein [Aminobacter sp. MET-1]